MCSVRARRVASSRVAWLVLFLDLPQAAQVWNLKYLCTFWYTHAQANTHACTSTCLAHCALRTPLAGCRSAACHSGNSGWPLEPIGASRCSWSILVDSAQWGELCEMAHECAISFTLSWTSAYKTAVQLKRDQH